MDNHQRQMRLLKLVAEHGSASVHQLVEWLGASPSTVRRDLRLLDQSGQIRRVHGGGERVGVRHGTAPLRNAFPERAMRHPGRKRAIAQRATAMCADGTTVMIGGGTTTACMAEFLAERRLRILTNSFDVARRLLETGDNEVILSGGRIYAEQSLILSPFDTEAIQYCYADRLFIGAYAMSATGLRESDPLLVQAGRRLVSQAQQVVVLADSSKFANRDGMSLCGLDQVGCVITDSGAPDAAVQMLERAGVDVVVVSPDWDLEAAAAPYSRN
jgi:DeoR family ulaG and ulaABCDEF operon transcriptional repressor